jgi:hypothetical protein
MQGALAMATRVAAVYCGQEEIGMKGQEVQHPQQAIQAQCAYPTFMELVLDAVERVLRDSEDRE